MFMADTPIRIGTNRYEGNLISNILLAAEAVIATGVYNEAFRRTGLTPIPSALFSIVLTTTEFAALQGICYLYKQRKFYYQTAIIFSQIAYLFPKIVIVAALTFSRILPFSTATLTVGLLIPALTRAGNKACLSRRSSDY